MAYAHIDKWAGQWWLWSQRDISRVLAGPFNSQAEAQAELEIRSPERRCRRVEKAARALISRVDFWDAVRAASIGIPGEYDDLIDATGDG